MGGGGTLLASFKPVAGTLQTEWSQWLSSRVDWSAVVHRLTKCNGNKIMMYKVKYTMIWNSYSY